MKKFNSGPDSCSTSVALSSVPLPEQIYAPPWLRTHRHHAQGGGGAGEPEDEVVSQASLASCEWLAREGL